MKQCPECRNQIPDDSAYCDQCGKELRWCPQCQRPKRGTECPVCGSVLIPGRQYLANGASCGSQPGERPQAQESPQPAPQPQPQPSPRPAPQATATAPALPTALVGNGWRLTLSEGDFGRSGGMWSELSTCTYVSGSHGRITRDASGWKIIDNGSTNGTFVDGKRLAAGEPVLLRKGSLVRIATLDFKVE